MQRFKTLSNLLAINLFIAFLLLLLIESFSYLFMESLPRLSGLIKHGSLLELDGRIHSPIYESKKVARKIYDEFSQIRTRYEPYSVWALAPYSGEMTNINAEGQRKTCYQQQSENAKEAYKIFMFGGSTLFGTGVDDCNTIPSFLAKEISQSGRAFEISNFGVTGFQSTQELLKLMEELKRGRRPDLVIFYDGVNDVYAGVHSPGLPGSHQNLDKIEDRLESSALSNLFKSSNTTRFVRYVHARFRKQKNTGERTALAERSRKSVEIYKRNLEILDTLSHRYGFKYLAFWQPVLYATGKEITPYEASTLSGSEGLKQVFQATYAAVNVEPLGDLSFRNLASEFDDRSGELFVDFCHLGPAGNKIIAQAMMQSLPRFLWPTNIKTKLGWGGTDAPNTQRRRRPS